MTDVHGVTSFANGATQLQTLIVNALPGIDLGGTGAPILEVRTGISQFLDAKVFNIHNFQSAIVQAEATYQAYNAAGTLVWTLKIIWDADNPPVGSTQTAHYGWEIYKNNARVAGPGHVFFIPTLILPHYRLPGVPTTEDSSLKREKEGAIGTGKIKAVAKYYRNTRLAAEAEDPSLDLSPTDDETEV